MDFNFDDFFGDFDDIGGMVFVGGDGVSGPDKIAQKIELEAWAKNRADELLGRDGPYEGPCRYCGTEEDICKYCGCCTQDHVLMMQERFDSPEALREYGFTRYIRAINDDHDLGISLASAYITKTEHIFEMMNEIARKRRDAIESGVEEDLSPDVWSELDDLDFSQLD